MLHIIENEFFICTIDSLGAEIRSLKDKSNGEEYIWPINKDIWASSSPVLFPSIGNIKLNKILFNGEEYSMPKHGIVRNNPNLKFTQLSISECAFNLAASKETLKQYPFDFSLTVSYKLEENRLIMRYGVENKDKMPMPFSWGGHTAYLCDLSNGKNLSDYVVEFPEGVELKSNYLESSGLLSTSTKIIEAKDGILELSDWLFNEDALVFSGINCDWVRLRRKDQTKGVLVKFKGFPNLALWSKPKADFLCIEPWLGLPDKMDESIDLAKKSTYKVLNPNEKFSQSIETIIE